MTAAVWEIISKLGLKAVYVFEITLQISNLARFYYGAFLF